MERAGRGFNPLTRSSAPRRATIGPAPTDPEHRVELAHDTPTDVDATGHPTVSPFVARGRRSPGLAVNAPVEAPAGPPVPVDEARLLEVLEIIRPALQADGGDIVYVGVDDAGVVSVELVGACGTCPVSTDTLKAGVERILRDRVPGVTEVVQVGLESASF
jgi:Fe-S cluster biogenesis protein NfuA